MIEFYGEVSDYTKRRTDKLRKRYYAIWLAALSVLLGVAAAVSGATGGGFVPFLVFALLIGAVAAYLFFGPMKKNIAAQKWKFRVTIDGGELVWEQYLPAKTVRKVKKLDRVKRVVKTDFCYYIVFNDIGNAVVCERCLLKKGTFERFEQIFEGKIRYKYVG